MTSVWEVFRYAEGAEGFRLRQWDESNNTWRFRMPSRNGGWTETAALRAAKDGAK